MEKFDIKKYDVIIASIIVAFAIVLVPVLQSKFDYNNQIEQVWGKENYEKLLAIQVEDVEKELERRANGGEALEVDTTIDTAPMPEPTPEPTPAPEEVKTIEKVDAETKASVYQDRPFLGTEDAKITWVEFSDFNCSFCKRQHQQGTYNQVKANFEDSELNFIYKPHPIFNMEAAVATDCLAFGKNRGIYHDVIAKIYETEDSTNKWIEGFVTDLGWDVADFNACLEDNSYRSALSKGMSAANRLFGITWTPGNVLINNETGEYSVIPGAYPAYKFEEEINMLLGK